MRSAAVSSTAFKTLRQKRRETERLEKLLVDDEYEEFFAQFSKDQLKNFHFFDDIPGLGHRNAFRLQKSGDKNNQCFDTVYFKLMPKYDLLGDGGAKALISSKPKTKKTLTRKELRRRQLNAAREKRYFVRVHHELSEKLEKPIKEPLRSTMSDKMWLYLEANKLLKLGITYKNILCIFPRFILCFFCLQKILIK